MLDLETRELLLRVETRTIEALQRTNETRKDVAEVHGFCVALDYRIKEAEKAIAKLNGKGEHHGPGPMRPPLASEKDLARLARKVAREEVEEITGRHELDAKDRQILELKTELRKVNSGRMKIVNWSLHVLAGVTIAVLVWLLTGHVAAAH